MLDCCCFLYSQHVEMRCCCLWQTTVCVWGWEISWSQMWPFHQRSPKSHQWFHQISTNSIALTCTHSSNNVQVTFISLCESVTLSPRPPVRRKKDRLRSGIRFLLLAQISFSEICLLSDYRNYTPSLALQGGVLGTRGLQCNGMALPTPQHFHSDCGSAPAHSPHGFVWLLSDVSIGKTIKSWKNNTDIRVTIFWRGNTCSSCQWFTGSCCSLSTYFIVIIYHIHCWSPKEPQHRNLAHVVQGAVQLQKAVREVKAPESCQLLPLQKILQIHSRT